MAPLDLDIPSRLSRGGSDNPKLLNGTRLEEHEELIAEVAAVDQDKVHGLTTLAKITVKCGTFVDVITFHYSDGLTSVRGDNGGELREPFVLLPGEHLAAINGRESDSESLDAVQFETDRGRKSGFYGNLRGGRSFSLRASEGSQIWDIERKSAHCGSVAKLVEKRGLPRIPSPVLDIGELRSSALDDGRCCELAGYVGPRLMARGGPRVQLLQESGVRIGRLCERLEAGVQMSSRCAITRGDNAPASNVQLVLSHEDTPEARRKRALTAQLDFMSRCMDTLAPPEGSEPSALRCRSECLRVLDEAEACAEVPGLERSLRDASGTSTASQALPLLPPSSGSASLAAPSKVAPLYAAGARHNARQASESSPRWKPQSTCISSRQVRLPKVRGFRPQASGSVGSRPSPAAVGAADFWRRDPRCVR